MVQRTTDPLGFRSAFEAVRQRTHSGLVIAVAAILDSQLERCLKQAMQPLSKKMYAELFDPMRALGSFASKITMAYALGIIARDVYVQLEKVRKLRNAFAHSSDLLHFRSPSIAPLIDRLKQPEPPQAKALDAQFLDCIVPIDRALDAFLAKRNVRPQ